MHSVHPSLPTIEEITHLIRVRWRLWLVPAVLVATVVGVYAATHQDTWESAQALIVRNEASNAEKGPGKFSQPEEMKTVQETILELVKSRGVLEAALREIGPPVGSSTPEAWPTDHDIAATRKLVRLVPPKGAEFGKTEVFYLNVKAKERARSIALNEAIFKRLQIESQHLRELKAQSMIHELSKTVQVAKSDLETATAILAATERQLGSDLAELRAMSDMTSSDSALRRSAEEIRSQLRENTTAEKANEELLTVLRRAQDDPGSLVATPNRLLESQPSLRRLKEGLVDAQLRTAALMGMKSAEHPHVKAARETEEEIGQHLHNELALAIRGVTSELRLNAERRNVLDGQLATTLQRLDGLARVRADYANEVAEVKNRSLLLERAEQNLAEARAAQAGAVASSIISPIDSPDGGIYPIGPGRIVIALSGILGGLFTGFGLVFLGTPITADNRLPTTSTNGRTVGPVANEPRPAASSAHGRFSDCRLSLKQALQRVAGGRTGRRAP